MIYRIENKDGIGPFLSQGYRMFEHSVTQRHNKLPLPFEEGLPYDKELGHICAFPSRKVMLQWFTKAELRYLLKNGYNLYGLTTRKYHRGKYQITLLSENIKSKRKIS